mgnify:CR=1 FL=1
MSSDIPYSRKHPFPAPLLVNRNLCGPGSEKETRHVEFSLAGSGLQYEAGDSLGVHATNDPTLVDEIIGLLRCSPDAEVLNVDKQLEPLRAALLRHCVITHPDRKFLAALVEKGGANGELAALLVPERKAGLDEYLWGREVVDFLAAAPGLHFEPAEFVATLRKLQPRLYSLASSQRVHPDEAHLAIAAVRYESHGRVRRGVCSTFLGERLPVGEAAPVFVHSAKGFRLPDDPARDIIMVGPGTGVAPFRAFLEDRRATGATGRNWLFFGEQHAAANFFYREEFERAMADGFLTRLDTAFSRDQAHKIYVQHRLLERGAEVWRWIDAGAEFFVCGDAKRMAKDVDHALIEIVVAQGGRTPETAAEYVETMRREKRYKRDVY